MKRPKILLLSNTIAPYRIPVFNYLARKANITFVFLSGMLKNLKLKVHWDEIKFHYQILSGKQIFFGHSESPLRLNRGFLRLLIKENPDVIVASGYNYIESIFGLIYAKLKNRRFVLWSGSTPQSSRSRNFAIMKMKRTIIRKCNSFLAYGSDAADYLIAYGADKNTIVTSCNTVDLQAFHLKSKEFFPNRELFKRQHNLPCLNILFSGQLIPRKNLPTLIKAFRLLGRTDCGLIILGDGYKQDEYITYCKDHGIANVFFKGHQDFPELIKYYVVSDLFVLPSYREVWGLVINEAMSCGLPILCSNRAGAARDLVKDEVNGYTFNPEDIHELKGKLRLLLDDAEKRKEMGRNSFELIKDCTPQKYAEDMLKAISLALS